MKFLPIIIFFIQLFAPINQHASIVKILPTQKDKTYKSLPGNNKNDRENIKLLFTMLGKYGKISILLHHKKKIEKLGEEIGHVHPWMVIEEVSKTPEMRHYMKNIISDPFKWHPVIKGLRSGILLEIQKNNFFQYFEDYSTIRNIPVPLIRSYINFSNPKKTNFEKLIKMLINY